MKILKFQAVTEKTTLSRSAMNKLIADGSFPSPIELTSKISGWIESEVDDWILSKIAIRDGMEGNAPSESKFYKLDTDGSTPIQCTNEERIGYLDLYNPLKFDKFVNGRIVFIHETNGVTVVTYFTGFDKSFFYFENPVYPDELVLFETMVFGHPDHDEDEQWPQWYTSYEKSEIGHLDTCLDVFD